MSIIGRVGLALLICGPCWGQATGIVEIDLLDQATEEPLECRVQITDARGRFLRARGASFEAGWNLVKSPLIFRGRPGEYRYRVFRGPEYASGHGEFTLDKRSSGYDVLRLPRHANLSDEAWVGGDLASCMTAEQTRLWLEAEGLSMAVSLSKSVEGRSDVASDFEPKESQRWVEASSFWDDRPGSGLVFHHWMPPADVPSSVPSSRLLFMAKQAETPPKQERMPPSGEEAAELPVHIEIQRLWARDLPLWLAFEKIDSIQLLSLHLSPDGSGATKFQPLVDPEPGRFRGDRAAGQIVESLYWRVLEAGLRIPPTAGSGFGSLPSPLGYNRVYAAVASDSSSDWWRAIAEGRSFVTSGPLLRVLINGEPPGAVFRVAVEEKLELDVAVKLTVSDPVDYLDVIFNGRTLYQARLDEFAKQRGKIPKLEVSESGWLLVRVVTGREDSYRIATTAPFYVEMEGRPRISRKAVEFFQRWLEEAAIQIADTEQAQNASVYVEAARKYWRQRLREATVP